MTYTKDNIVFKPHPTNPRFKNLTGDVFRYLTVLGLAGIRDKRTYWWCECNCGNISKVDGGNLRNRNTMSCGCLRHDGTQHQTHGESKNGKVSPELQSFFQAKARCQNPKHISYKYYGERGIEFRLESVQELITAIGRRPTLDHSLDRIYRNGHYEVGNIRWATETEQQRNRRSNRVITIGNQSLCVAEWAELCGVPPSRIAQRLFSGYCDTCAVQQPLLQPCPHRIRR